MQPDNIMEIYADTYSDAYGLLKPIDVKFIKEGLGILIGINPTQDIDIESLDVAVCMHLVHGAGFWKGFARSYQLADDAQSAIGIESDASYQECMGILETHMRHLVHMDVLSDLNQSLSTR